MVRKTVIVGVVMAGVSLASGSPVNVSIPNMNVMRGTTVNVPLKATGVLASDSLIAYQAVLVFGSSVIQGMGATKIGTMTQNWDDPTVGVKENSDTLRVIGITTNQPGKRWTVNDTLIKLIFFVPGTVGATTTIRIYDIKLFNAAGAISISSKTDGVMTVISNPSTTTLNINLYTNWNLISFALSPNPSTLPEALGGVPVGFVFSYVSGVGPKTWDSVRPAFLNDLKNVDGLHGYWMKLNSQTTRTLSLTGSPVSVNTPLLLYKGWSLVGYLPNSADSLSHSFLSLGKAYRFVSGYDAGGGGTKTWDRSRPVFLNDLKVLNPKFGYWVKMDTVKSLVYPTGGYKAFKMMAWNPLAAPSRRVESSPYSCDFWAYQPELFVTGDTVKVFDKEGVLCGDTLVSVEKAFLVHVTGDDPFTSDVDEGALEGDTLRFEIGGKKMRVAGASLTTPDTAIMPGRPAIWENMGSKHVRLAEEINAVPETSKPISEKTFVLFQNHPNPFNSQTLIGYQTPDAGPITLAIFDIKGRLIRHWIQESAPAGIVQILWDGRDDWGSEVTTGIYVYRVEAGSLVLSKKCLYIK
jgi:hypothetical protein